MCGLVGIFDTRSRAAIDRDLLERLNEAQIHRGPGHDFRTHCDTGVIVHAWDEWGETCVRRLRGLLPNGHLASASELKALKRLPAPDRAIDGRAVEDYFALGYIPEPRSI